MKRMLLAAVLVVLGGTAGARADDAAPKMFVPQLRYDFGKLFEQEKYIHDFVVKNQGTADLVIQEVKPTCGCTVAKYDRVIPAGGEGKINLAIEGAQVHGNFSKTAIVHSNDPELPLVTLTLDGTEIPFIDVKPDDHIYLQGRFGEEVQRELTVQSNEESKDFKVTGAESDMDDKISYEVKPGPEPNVYTLVVRKNPKMPAMASVGSLTLHTNSEKAPDKVLQVQVITKGSFTVQPSTVNFGAVPFGHEGEAAKPVVKTVTVLRTDAQFKIDSVDFDSDHYTATVKEVVPGQKYDVEVTFQPPIKKESRQREVASMTIHTSDPNEPLVSVKLVARAM